MASSLRELRQRRKSVMTTKKITRAMELIASSRIIKAQQAAQASLPYTRVLNRAVAAVASYSGYEHPLTHEEPSPRRSAVLILTSDRGLAGAYSANVIKMAERIVTTMRQQEGREVITMIVGRKGAAWANFRGRKVFKTWEGFSEKPTFQESDEVANVLIDLFLKPYEEGGVDEIHVIYTRFESMLVQEPRVRRVLPLRVVRDAASEPEGGRMLPLYEFEPDPETVLDALLPLYVRNRIHFYLMQSAASEIASRQRAMKSATDNAEQLIQALTREANQARQAEITQEITEIVGGASALSEGTESE